MRAKGRRACPEGASHDAIDRRAYSVAALTDETGAIVEAATYDTYGQVAMHDGSAQAVAESPVGNPYYFTGRRLDLLPTASSPQPAAKQLYHYRARAYDPGNGRFNQRDPYGIGDYVRWTYLSRYAPAIRTGGWGEAANADGMHPYMYASGTPQTLVDWTGRLTVSCFKLLLSPCDEQGSSYGCTIMKGMPGGFLEQISVIAGYCRWPGALAEESFHAMQRGGCCRSAGGFFEKCDGNAACETCVDAAHESWKAKNKSARECQAHLLSVSIDLAMVGVPGCCCIEDNVTQIKGTYQYCQEGGFGTDPCPNNEFQACLSKKKGG